MSIATAGRPVVDLSEDRWPGRSRGRVGLLVLAILLGGLVVETTRGDVIRFAGGGEVEVLAEQVGGRWLLSTPGRTWEFSTEQVQERIRLPSPEEEWPERATRARRGTAGEQFAAGWWALERGLTTEAVAMFRASRQADPAQEPSGRVLALCDRLEVDRPDPDLGPLNRALGGQFAVARGPHVVLLHQHDPAEAMARVALLERVITTFYLELAGWGVDLPMPAWRMASVWLADQDAYLGFLHREGADAFRSTRGYFHPTLHAIVAFDAREGAPQRPAREAVAAARAVLARRPGSARSRGELARRELLFDLEWRGVDVATATHEQVHQLVEASGLCPGPGAWPVWLQEGLAMQFEVVRGGRWAGVGRPNDFRLPVWRALNPPSRLEAILRDSGFGRGYQPGRYAEAWALVYFLRREHPREFRAYLDLLQTPTPVGEPGRGLAAFGQVFGSDLGPLETHWKRTIGKLRTPAEAAGGSAEIRDGGRVDAPMDGPAQER